MRKIAFFMFIFLLFFILRAEKVEFDLAASKNQVKTLEGSSKIIESISFINAWYKAVKEEKYSFTSEITYLPKPEPLPSGIKLSSERIQECQKLKDKIEEIEKIADEKTNDQNGKWVEKEIKSKVDELEVLVKEADPECNLEEANEILNHREFIIESGIKLREGEQLQIDVKRGDHTWTFILKIPRGEWFTSYGFGIVSKSLYRPTYFLKENPAGSEIKYIITKKEKADTFDLEFIPSIYFWWMPNKFKTGNWNWGLIGGIGADWGKPAMSLGFGGVYNYNIGFGVSLLFHQQYTLNGKYKKDSTLNELLEFDQLHEPVYRPNFCFSIFFRFDKNPFAKAESSNKTEDKKTDKPETEKSEEPKPEEQTPTQK